MKSRRRAVLAAPGLVVAVLVAEIFGVTSVMTHTATAIPANHGGYQTTTPIKHLVVTFQENVSFDHYFGTYPYATNLAGDTPSRHTVGECHAAPVIARGLAGKQFKTLQCDMVMPLS